MGVTTPATDAVMQSGVAHPTRRLRAPALAVLGLVAVAATACASASAREQPAQKPQEIGLLFAATAEGERWSRSRARRVSSSLERGHAPGGVVLRSPGPPVGAHPGSRSWWSRGRATGSSRIPPTPRSRGRRG